MNSYAKDAALPGFSLGRPRPRLGRDFLFVGRGLVPVWDFVSVMVAGFLAHEAYAAWTAYPGFDLGFWEWRGAYVVIGALLASMLLHPQSRAVSAQHTTYPDLAWGLTRRFAVLVAVLLVIGFSTRALDSSPRGWALYWLVASFVLTLSHRVLFLKHLRFLANAGVLRETIAVLGAGPVADRLVEYVRKKHHGSVDVVGIFDDRRSRVPENSMRPTGGVDDLIELGKQHRLDWVVVTLPWTAERRLLELAHRLKSLSVSVALCPPNVGMTLPCCSVEMLADDLPMTLLVDRPIRRWNGVLKGAEDLILGGLITLACLPLLGLVALAVKLDSPGPVLFKQKRHGANNNEFEIYKFRTMYWQPEGRSGPLQQTSRADRRVTRVGRFLRRTSLDELPQLFNVLRGEMSLVGPRPHAVDMRTAERLGAEITSDYPHRHRVKPGITGWAQVNGSRGATETPEQLLRRVSLDLHYVEHWSLGFDIRILVMTLWNVVRGEDAY